jgi:hypothetical protein
MNNPLVALYVCYLALAVGLLYVAWQGTEAGSVGKPCFDALLKIGDVAGDPAATRDAQQDQEVKCKAMMNYDMAIYRMVPKAQ